MGIKPFDEKAKCPKCDGEDVGVTYSDGWMLFQPVKNLRREHLIRNCCRCRFQWAEECVDRKAPVEEPPHV